MIKTFKVISFLEGVSYLILLFIGVPLKYFAENPVVVKSVGMPHGILFLAYVVGVFLIRKKMKWDLTNTLIALVASLLPFGTFYINKKFFGSY